jgi:anti-anti-sigma factor
VGAAARLENRDRAQQSWLGAQVLQQDDVVGEVRDAVFGQLADVEEVGYLAGHDRADALAREALHERVEKLAEAHERLSSTLDAARADGMTVLLDLSAVSFIDSTGLRILLSSARAVDAHEWALFIVRASSAVWRLVELTGTRSQLPLVAPPSSTRSAPPETAPQRLAG